MALFAGVVRALLRFWFWHWYSFEETDKNGITHHPRADVINPIAAALGGAVLAWAAFRQARNSTDAAKAAIEQANTASQRHKEQTDADRQRRLTESYSKAVEQLASNNRGTPRRHRGISLDGRTIGFMKDVHHGVADQFGNCVSELLGAERIDRNDGAGRVDHEIHGRVVLEDRPPLLLAVPQRLFSAFALGQIEHEGYALVSSLSECRSTNQRRHAASVFPKKLPLGRLDRPRGLELRQNVRLGISAA